MYIYYSLVCIIRWMKKSIRDIYFLFFIYKKGGVLFRYKVFTQQVLNHRWDRVYKTLNVPYPIYKAYTQKMGSCRRFSKILLLVTHFCQRVHTSVSFSEYMMNLDGPVALHKPPGIRIKGENSQRDIFISK